MEDYQIQREHQKLFQQSTKMGVSQSCTVAGVKGGCACEGQVPHSDGDDAPLNSIFCPHYSNQSGTTMKLIWGSSWWRAWLPSPGNTSGGRQESLLQELGCQARGPRKTVQYQEGGTETYNQKQLPLSKLSLLWRGCKATSWMQTKQALNRCWKWTGIYTSLHVVCGYVADTQGLVLHPQMGRVEEHVLIFLWGWELLFLVLRSGVTDLRFIS